MSRAKSGGGATMNKVVSTRNPKQEPTNHHIDPTRPSQIGMSVHYVKSDLYQSSTTPKGPTTPVAGVGGGRMVMRAGSQSKTPAPTPMRGPRRSLFD
jgi:hypothetical protein